MFQNRLHGDYLHWYLKSSHKDRIDLIGESLISKNYKFAVVQNHLLEWIRLSRYLSENNFSLPSNIFIEEIQEYMKIRFPEGSETRRRGIRAAIRIFLEADNMGNFFRRIKIKKSPHSFLYQQWILPHLNYLRHDRHLAESTLRHRQAFFEKFIGYLEKSGVCCEEDLSFKLIIDSFVDLDGWGREMRLGYASALRGFLKWAYSENLFLQDFTNAVINIRSYSDTKLPEVLSNEEVENILSSIDRGNQIGKRNYAIIILAARYGLRPVDIRRLSLDNIQWRKGIISFTQSKTGVPHTLPLLEDVAEALIDYLKVRPSNNYRNIFIRHIAPYEPFSADNNFSQVMNAALTQAGISQRKGLRGIYLFRHSLATRLLKEGKSFKSISDVLGHSDVSSSFKYTKVDMDELRTVSISIKEVMS